jgi:hypothetical protein
MVVKRILLQKKIVHQHTSCVYEIIKPGGEVLIVETLSEAAETINVDIKTLSKHLDIYFDNYIELKNNKIKRISVFYKKS